MHHGEVGLEHLGEANGDLRASGVRGDGDDTLPAEPEVAEVTREELLGGHVVDGDREEPLQLTGVEIHRQQPVDTRELEHVRDEAARDGLAGLRLAVLPRVGEPRDDRSDPLGGRELRSLDHQEQLHEVLIDGWTAGLHEEDVGAANRLAVAAVRLAVGERLQLDLAELDAQALGDPLREIRVRATGEHHEPLLRRQRDRVTGLRLGLLGCDLEPRQLLLNRSAFHLVLP